MMSIIHSGLRVLARIRGRASTGTGLRKGASRIAPPSSTCDVAGKGADIPATPSTDYGVGDDWRTGEWLLQLHADAGDRYDVEAAAETAQDVARLTIRQNYRAARLDARIDVMLDRFAPGWRDTPAGFGAIRVMAS